MRAAGTWGTGWRQRLRLMPMYLALRAAGRLSTSRRPAVSGMPVRPGISVVIPERGTPELLAPALASVERALARCAEPSEVIVVVNGADPAAYADLKARHLATEWLHFGHPLGFSAAVARGVARTSMPWTLLLNSDCELDERAVELLARARAFDVFAAGAHIEQRSEDGRVEETGLVDWYADARGLRLFHAPLGPEAVSETLCVSGGAGLFRTDKLREYVADSACYDPFYWEDVEWGVRAWREGLRCVVVRGATARHARRGTIARYYPAHEIERIGARNGLLFEARHGWPRIPAHESMRRICDSDYATQRELAHPVVAVRALSMRARHRFSPPYEPPVLADSKAVVQVRDSFSQRRPRRREERPLLLVVSPYCVFPPRHGAARRTAQLMRHALRDFDVAFVSDEATLHDSRSFAGFDGLCDVRLVQRPRDPASEAGLGARLERHAHPAMVEAVRGVLETARPAVVLVEHAELSPLVRLRSPGERWVLGLHDAVQDGDFESAGAASRWRGDLGAFDAVTVCSDEDRLMVRHPHTAVVPNGTALPAEPYEPSKGAALLFVGPFRYANNRDGILAFLEHAYPEIVAAVPDVRLVILGGDEGKAHADDPLFRQPGIALLAHQEDIASQYRRCALTVNPVKGIRGSSIKAIESAAHGRACLSTRDALRGFADRGLPGLIACDDLRGMARMAIALLRDEPARHRHEVPGAGLDAFSWDAIAERHLGVLHGPSRGE